MIWGCLIGLPAYLIAEASQETSLPTSLFGEGAVTEDISGLIYLVNGILCLFVVEAVRRPTVVSVWIPLRRATLLGLLFSIPAFFVHEEFSTINEWTNLPEWAWVLVASALIFLLSRIHEWLTEVADRLFDRDFRHAEEHLAAIGRAIQQADALGEIERLLVDEPLRALKLASAALFREEDSVFRRRASAGWSAADAVALRPGAPPLEGGARWQTVPARRKRRRRRPRRAPRTTWRGLCSACPSAIRGAGLRFSSTAATRREPILTTTSGGCSHASLTERKSAYAHIEREQLRRKIVDLESQLARASEKRAAR